MRKFNDISVEYFQRIQQLEYEINKMDDQYKSLYENCLRFVSKTERIIDKIKVLKEHCVRQKTHYNAATIGEFEQS